MAFTGEWCVLRGVSSVRVGDGEPASAAKVGTAGPWTVLDVTSLQVAGSSSALAELSAGGEVVAVAVEEHVTGSHAARVVDGRLDWLVRFDASYVFHSRIPWASRQLGIDLAEEYAEDIEAAYDDIAELVEDDPLHQAAGLVVAGQPPRLAEFLTRARERSLAGDEAAYADVPAAVFGSACGLSVADLEAVTPTGSLPVDGPIRDEDLTGQLGDELPPGWRAAVPLPEPGASLP